MSDVIFIDFVAKKKASGVPYVELTLAEFDAYEIARSAFYCDELPVDRKVMLKDFLDFYRPHYEFIARRCEQEADFEKDDE